MAGGAHSGCLLEWHPYTKDRTMGLNHQFASLSCAIAEAHYLGRTLLIPDRMCLFGLHTSRWPGKVKPGERCVPMDEVLDVALLSRLVPVALRDHTNRTRHRADRARVIVVSGRAWNSERVKREHPCRAGEPPTLVRRHTDGFWFSQCTRRTTDSSAVIDAVYASYGGSAQSRRHYPRPINTLLRSGLFHAPAIKQAAAAVRAAIGGPYGAIHVRRSDKLIACAPKDCKTRDELTRPAAIESALRQWFAPGHRIYIGSTEPPAFFEPLRQSYSLYFAEDFAPLLSNVSNNYALYAVETLVAFGSVGYVETLGYTSAWFTDSCFPAGPLRTDEGACAVLKRAGGGRASGGAITIGAASAGGMQVNGVTYGSACVRNPPCGRKMFLVPKPTGCGAPVLPVTNHSAASEAEALWNATAQARKRGCHRLKNKTAPVAHAAAAAVDS